MVVLGMAVGAALFYFQDCDMWPVHAVPVWKMLAVMLVGMTLLPVPVSMDVRGWQEMHPLNGPGWSLFYEYCANILYALVVRRFPKWLLGVLVAVSGAALIRFALTSPSGDIIGGWSLTAEQLGVGFTRMMYPFFGGLLLSRLVRPGMSAAPSGGVRLGWSHCWPCRASAGRSICGKTGSTTRWSSSCSSRSSSGRVRAVR